VFQELVIDLLGSLHGPPAHALLFLLVALAGIGAPWAQDVVLLAAAALTVQAGGLHPLAMAATAWLAIVAGDALSVWFGHHYGARWVRRPWAARFVPPQRLPGLEEGARRHAEPLSFVTRFLPGQRATVFFLAGSLRMPWRPFLLADGAAALLQVGLWLFAARSLGWTWQGMRGAFERADDWLTLGLVVVLVVWWLRARRVQA
jgi:membrane protein DedA with SNARE-associated domain